MRGDICDREAVRAALDEGTDAIINFAAESHVDRSIASADEFLRTNILGTQVLLDAARARGVGRFVQVSTDEVMGSLPEDDDRVLHRSRRRSSRTAPTPRRRRRRNTRARRASHLRTRHGRHALRQQLRAAPVPRKVSSAACSPTRCATNRSRSTATGATSAIGFTSKTTAAPSSLALVKGRSGEAYNIGARNERRNIEVAESVLNALGKPTSLIRHVKDRPGHDRRYAIDPIKAETELGWQPRETWETGLRKTIAWYRDNSEWIERVRDGAYREFYARQYGAEVGAR